MVNFDAQKFEGRRNRGRGRRGRRGWGGGEEGGEVVEEVRGEGEKVYVC